MALGLESRATTVLDASATRRQHRLRLGPGWPLAAVFVGFPLWWLLGLRNFIFLLALPPMLVELARRRRVAAPRGFGIWLLFVCVVVLSFLMLNVSAPGAKGGTLSTRTGTALFRLLWYLTLTVVLLYVGNMTEEELPTTRVARWLGYMFVVTVLGGYFGMLLPHFQMTTPIEAVLPRSIGTNQFVRSVTHVVAAQVQAFLGYAEARPSAPWAHANDWGANFGLFLPFFLYSWFGPTAGMRRRFAPLVLAAAFVPFVYSLNRGLWSGIAVVALFVAVRMAMAGRMWALGAFVGVVVVLAATLVLTPLGSTVSQRLATPHSNNARENLSSMTVQATLDGSPVIGYGSTRAVAGNFKTLSGASTQSCPRCAPPALGTQGHAWLVIFSQGFLGAALFFGFMLYRLSRHVRDPAPIAVAGCAALVFFFVVVWVYDLLDAPLFTLMIALALMWRHERSLSGSAARRTGSLRQAAT